MSKRASPTVLGAFVVGGIALLVVAIAALGSGRLFRHTESFVVYFRQSVNGLRIGAPVKFKGIEIGEVRSIRINLSRLQADFHDIRIPVVIELDQARLSAEGTTVELDDSGAIDHLIASGLRARLETESLVTGVRFVALDFEPDRPAELVADPTVDLQEIPVVSGGAERVKDEATVVLEGLAKVDYAALATSATKLLDDTRDLVGSPALNRAVNRLDKVTANLEGATMDLRRLLHPDGALYADLDAALQEMRQAARAMRQLAKQLSRDPGSLLRGGEQP